MASLGSKVLQTRSVELAMVYKMRTRVLSSLVNPDAMKPTIARDCGGTSAPSFASEDEIVEKQIVSGIALAKDEAKVSLIKIADKPGVAAKIFGPLAAANINVDMIVQNVSADGKHTDLTFTVTEAELPRALDVLKSAKKDIGYSEVASSGDVVKVSVVGIGMRSHAGVAAHDVQGAGRKGHQHHRDHHERDQDFGADRRGLCRTCRAHAARPV